MGFTKMGISPNILKALVGMGFSKPTPIQEKAIPLLLQGEDLIGQAQTGTGKTAAFGICILERVFSIEHQKPGKVRALVLTPTRELAVQVTGEIQKIARHHHAKVLAVYGGQNIERQLKPLASGVDIVVGTPGRLLDHIERGTLKLENVETVVLDEADRMLDMGFIEDIEKILRKTPKERQTLLFSATMPKEILELSKKYMNAPQKALVSQDSLSAKNIRQFYIEVSKFDRLNALLVLLKEQQPDLALIFVRTKRGADRINEILSDRGFNSLALHGDMSQNKRDRAMRAFREKKTNMLVATDLASRGLDVTGISHVINFDMTDDPYTYLHRIGRTGRMGKRGMAISFVFFDQANLIGIIEKVTDSKMEQMKITVTKEKLPKRVRFSSPQQGRGHMHRGGQQRGYGRGKGSQGQARGQRHSRDSRDTRGRYSDRRKRQHRSYRSRGHQYFGRRN